MQVDIVGILIALAVDIDVVTHQLAGQLDVAATLADSQRHLVWLHEHFHLFVLLIHLDGRNLGGSQRTLNHNVQTRGVVQHIDILITQFADDAMDTGALDTHARTHRVDTVVVRLDGDLGTLAGDTDDVANGDETVVNLGNFGLEQALKEDG